MAAFDPFKNYSHAAVDGSDYIARNPNPVGEKDKLLAAPGGSRYDAAHARYHPLLKRAANTVGFYDINLMDAATGDVVYTVVKETDFGSNMYNGAFTQSGFARVAKRALDPRNGGKAVIEDYTAYTPSAFLPQMFAALPIIADGQTIGVFVAQIDIRALNNLLTDNEAVEQSFRNRTSPAQYVDYRGVEVISAYGPVEVARLRWAIASKQGLGMLEQGGAFRRDADALPQLAQQVYSVAIVEGTCC